MSWSNKVYPNSYVIIILNNNNVSILFHHDCNPHGIRVDSYIPININNNVKTSGPIRKILSLLML